MGNALEVRRFSRRSFMGMASLALTFGSSLALVGCGIQDIADWAPIGASAFAMILSIIGDPGTSVLILAIKAGFQDLPQDVAAYKANPSPTTLGKIDEVLSLLLGNFKDFMATVGIANPILGLIASLAGLILSAISGYIAKYFPASSDLSKTKGVLAMRFRVGPMTVRYTAKDMSVLSFKEQWNDSVKVSGVTTAQGYKFHIGLLEHFTRK